MDLEQRIAGLLPKAELDAAYLASEIGEEEYREILEAQGWMTSTAHAALLDTHAAGAPDHWPTPEPLPEDANRLPVTRPGRKPIKAPRGGARLTGHPLDEIT